MCHEGSGPQGTYGRDLRKTRMEQLAAMGNARTEGEGSEERGVST